MQKDDRPHLTRRAFVQRAAIVLGSLITVACGAGNTGTKTPTAGVSPTRIANTPSPKPPLVPTPTPAVRPSEQVVYVDNLHANADDANVGTQDRPLKTIGKAAAIAADNTQQSIGTRVLIAPGIYRESVSLQPKGGRTNAPISFRATTNGATIIAGSDVWGGWRKQGATQVYTHAWPYTWGLAPYPPGWQGNVDLKPIVRRREMIFVNGAALTQVLSSDTLKEGTFVVSEQSSMVSLVPPAGVQIENATVEVAVRAGIFAVEGIQNLTVSGLVFMHDNTPVGGTAVTFTNCTNGVVEDCQFLWNNWAGMTFQSSVPRISQGMIARRTIANHNGGIGLAAARIKDVLYEDNETSYNSWRAAQGKMAMWSNGGMKHLFVHGGIYRRHRAVGNDAPGCWFDTDCTDIEIEQAFFCENDGPGLFIEASQGPTSVTDCTICHNRRDAGLFSHGGSDVTLHGNILYGNGDAQIGVVKGARPIQNWETNAALKINPERWTMQKNIIVGTDTAPRLADIADGTRFFSTFDSDENTWYSPKKSGVFVIDEKGLDFATWRSVSGRDANSQFVDPRFVDSAHNDFHLRDDSPLRNG